MAKSRTDQLQERLRDLQASSGDVEGAAVVSVDGLSMASSLQAGTEEDRVSAMSAAMQKAVAAHSRRKTVQKTVVTK